ncbi:MAG: hypothetical protein LC732_09195 [Acidobacteria bacterium]|nr:hypothetical protein [Acidobacteriota bacterium]
MATTRADVTVEEFLAANPLPGSPGSLPKQELRRRLDDPAFAGRQRLFLGGSSSDPLVRVAARLSPHLLAVGGGPVGHLGFFDARDERAAAAECLQAAAAWLASEGAGAIVGPLDSDTWHRYRLNAGPFDVPPFPMEPWNPPWYTELWETSGFHLVETYSSKRIEDVAEIRPHLAKGVERSHRLGYRIRPLRRDDLQAELDAIHRISLSIFADNFLYSPLDRREFGELYAGALPLLDPDFVVFATAPDGPECGFVFSFAEQDRGLVHYKTIGVEARHRRSGVAAALADHVYSNALGKGLKAGNHALMRDNNASQGMDAGHGTVFRRYFLYGWSGG